MSPLRYPGGKALLESYISGVIEENYYTGCAFYEPYAGGASVSLELLRLGFIARAVLVERDPLVYAFCWSVLTKNDELCAAVEACPVTLETWHSLQPTRKVDDPGNCDFSLLQLGVAGLFFNRTNFSGILGAGPIGGANQESEYKIDCRFNKEKLVRQIKAVVKYADQISIHFGDAITFLTEHSEELATGFTFTYIDPPYYLQGKKLYRHAYVDEDHAALAEFIRGQAYPWVLSYDDHPRIRQLYEYTEIQMQPIYLDYKVRSNRTAQELVISNLQIPPPVYEGCRKTEVIEHGITLV
jgi:DNA adenine methylase